MYYISERNTGLSMTDQSTCEKRIVLYDQNSKDYFDEFFFAWNTISTPTYTVVLGEYIFRIPSSAYLVCGEEGGTTDVIMFDEIIGRGLRLDGDTNFIRVIDISSNTKYARNHRRDRHKIYKEEGFEFEIIREVNAE